MPYSFIQLDSHNNRKQTASYVYCSIANKQNFFVPRHHYIVIVISIAEALMTEDVQMQPQNCLLLCVVCFPTRYELYILC